MWCSFVCAEGLQSEITLDVNQLQFPFALRAPPKMRRTTRPCLACPLYQYALRVSTRLYLRLSKERQLAFDSEVEEEERLASAMAARRGVTGLLELFPS